MNLFRKINFTALVMTLAAAALSVLGIMKTGFYPAIIVLCILPAVPFSSKAYVENSGKVRGALVWLNALVILVVLWMSFVIVHDRVLGDCC
jgi:hypothetical protein